MIDDYIHIFLDLFNYLSLAYKYTKVLERQTFKVGFDPIPVLPNLLLNILIDGIFTFYRADHSISE